MSNQQSFSLGGFSALGDSMPAEEFMKRVTWQGENCLSCKWFRPFDPINADILSTGKCLHKDLKKFNLIISGRDWCNLFEEVSQRQIDALQERAMKEEGS